jgi:hypothetical protein
MEWITYGIPDFPDESDYEWFANDEWEWADLCRLYRNLMEEGNKRNLNLKSAEQR